MGQPPQTTDKVAEAVYFLGQMAATEGEEMFRYNVSAFLSAARSVKDTLKHEVAASVSGTDKKAAKDYVEQVMVADREMKLLADWRDTSSHEGGLRLLEATMEEVPAFPYSDYPGVNKWLLRRLFRTPPSHQPTSRVFMPGQRPPTVSEPRWFFTDIKDRDAYTVCAQHLGKVMKAVIDCETRYMP